MIAVVETDKRMAMLAQLLSQNEPCFIIRKTIDLVDAIKIASDLRAIVLPMSGVNEENEVKIGVQTIRLTELFNRMNLDAVIFTGRMNNALKQLNRKVINLSDIDAVRQCHAKLSAHGILSFLIQNTPEDFTKYSYDVLAYGACGKEITKCLMDNGCCVRVVSRRDGVLQGSINYSQYALCTPSDVIIVASSGCVLTEEMVQGWIEKPLYILDLSSGGIGVQKGVDKIVPLYSLGSLPSITGSDTSSKLLYQMIIKELNE